MSNDFQDHIYLPRKGRHGQDLELPHRRARSTRLTTTPTAGAATPARRRRSAISRAVRVNDPAGSGLTIGFTRRAGLVATMRARRTGCSWSSRSNPKRAPVVAARRGGEHYRGDRRAAEVAHRQLSVLTDGLDAVRSGCHRGVWDGPVTSQAPLWRIDPVRDQAEPTAAAGASDNVGNRVVDHIEAAAS